ncbi:hypothetical protein [Streptomyces sp. NPDC023838]|uniref:hypothetical protein n=1 Tax=Streptomyces sp. NPDC023838 TaxID=3154325 RepID=UPI0033E0C0EA
MTPATRRALTHHLTRLGIDPREITAITGTKEHHMPDTEEPAACAKCRQPFDPDDARFDGHARYSLTPYCRRCIDRCHDTESADHRCVICA